MRGIVGRWNGNGNRSGKVGQSYGPDIINTVLATTKPRSPSSKAPASRHANPAANRHADQGRRSVIRHDLYLLQSYQSTRSYVGVLCASCVHRAE